MTKPNQFRVHSKRNANLSGKANGYLPPRVLSEVDVLLEENLLAASVFYSTSILTEGQENAGFYKSEDIATTENPWLD